MFDATVSDDVLQLRRPETTLLSTGWDGGFARADAAYNVSVPEGWERTDLSAYLEIRLDRAGFDDSGPALFTGVDLAHARGARAGPVVVYATAGVSNPATLWMRSLDGETDDGEIGSAEPSHPGTVNLVVGTDRALGQAALANLLAVAVEAKTATLLAETGFTGTTTDAVVVASDPAGDREQFTGSATQVGASTRACVRDAVRASLRSRYADRTLPDSVDDAKHGVVTRRRTEVFSL